MLSLATFLLLQTPVVPIPEYLVVLEAALAAQPHAEAARQLAEHHGGDLWLWDGSWRALEEELLERKPRYLALVLAPETIDANLPRQLVPILARFGADPFVDCAFGLITGATGEETLHFVKNILRAPEGRLPAKKFEAVAVALDHCVYLSPRSKAGGVERVLETTELWMTGQQEDWEEFLSLHRGETRGAGLVEWGHCGDSQGIWLFSMYRNMDDEKHWKYTPEKVGWNPEGEMPRLTPAKLLDGVDLFPAVVLNGSCHSAVTHNTMVGPDIISTFGDTDGLVRFFPIEPEESFPLMAISHGATAYIAPLAANNANRVSIEQWQILAGGTSLGEVMKRTYDELVMGAAAHELRFALFEDGQREVQAAPMFDDTVHRVLFGDPAFTAWNEPVATTHDVQVVALEEGNTLRITITWTELASDPWVWDPWRDTRDPRGERGRIYERIPLERRPRGEPHAKIVEAEVKREGEWRPLELEASVLLEHGLDGEPVLHVKGSGARDEMNVYGPDAPQALRAVFQVHFGEPR